MEWYLLIIALFVVVWYLSRSGGSWKNVMVNSYDQAEEIQLKYDLLQKEGVRCRLRVENGQASGVAMVQIPGPDDHGSRYYLDVRAADVERAKAILKDAEFHY